MANNRHRTVSRYMGEYRESPRPRCFAAADIIFLIESGHREIADAVIEWTKTPAGTITDDGEPTPGAAEMAGWLRNTFGTKALARSWHRHRAAFAGLNDICACTEARMEGWIRAAEDRMAQVQAAKEASA